MFRVFRIWGGDLIHTWHLTTEDLFHYLRNLYQGYGWCFPQVVYHCWKQCVFHSSWVAWWFARNSLSPTKSPSPWLPQNSSHTQVFTSVTTLVAITQYPSAAWEDPWARKSMKVSFFSLTASFSGCHPNRENWPSSSTFEQPTLKLKCWIWFTWIRVSSFPPGKKPQASHMWHHQYNSIVLFSMKYCLIMIDALNCSNIL